MIINMENTTVSEVENRLLSLREEGGVVALGRVLTLVIQPDGDCGVEEAIEAANTASREHPCRVIVLVPSTDETADKLDAEIRVGGDAGASDVVVLRPSGAVAQNRSSLVDPLLLADAPIVAWWPQSCPRSPGKDQVGAIASRRITTSMDLVDARERLSCLGGSYTPGDTDLAWASVTLWRSRIAAILDEIDAGEVREVVVAGWPGRASVLLLAGWIKANLDVPVRIEEADSAPLREVRLVTDRGEYCLVRAEKTAMAQLKRPGFPDREVNLPSRTVADCLMEDLRRLDADPLYERTLNQREIFA